MVHEKHVIKDILASLEELADPRRIEFAKVDKDPVIDFMEKFKDRLHRRVVREVTSKLETRKKNV